MKTRFAVLDPNGRQVGLIEVDAGPSKQSLARIARCLPGIAGFVLHPLAASQN
jgi:hypothetical protein